MSRKGGAMNLLVGIVPRNSGRLLTDAAAAAGAGGGTVLMGRGTASNSVFQMLGFGDFAKDIVFVITDAQNNADVQGAMTQAAAGKRRPFGILFTLNVLCFMKTGLAVKEDSGMAEKTSHELITAIVNRGYADDVMAAARKAGAGGGTIMNARGTAREGDAKFFGMEIVPEKDMLLILAESEKSAGILESIKSLPFLSKPGSGIVFSSPADGFTVLGKKNKQAEK